MIDIVNNNTTNDDNDNTNNNNNSNTKMPMHNFPGVKYKATLSGPDSGKAR